MPKPKPKPNKGARGVANRQSQRVPSLPPAPWDHGTPEQRAARPHVVTERGETDPRTGKTVNPNGVTGLRYLDAIDALVAAGALPDTAHSAAEDYARLARAVRGSPAQRSCLDIGPVGHDGEHEDPQAARDWRDWREVQRRMGMRADAELSRLLWQGDGRVRDLGALRQGLQVVAEYFGRG